MCFFINRFLRVRGSKSNMGQDKTSFPYALNYLLGYVGVIYSFLFNILRAILNKPESSNLSFIIFSSIWTQSTWYDKFA